MYTLPIALTWFDLATSMWSEAESTGLQRLPPSVICSARLYSLRKLSHPHLCAYLDISRRKPERILIVSEAYPSNFASLTTPVTDRRCLYTWFMQCLDALDYLDNHQIVQACLSPKHIMLDSRNTVKLSGYVLFHATQWGSAVDFPIIDPIYSAPEVFIFHLSGRNKPVPSANAEELVDCPLTIFCDMWSLGLIFLELLIGQAKATPFHKSSFPSTSCHASQANNPFRNIQVLLEGLRLSRVRDCTLPDFLNLSASTGSMKDSDTLEKVFSQCLNFNPSLRPSPASCLSNLSMHPEYLSQGRGNSHINEPIRDELFLQNTFEHQSCFSANPVLCDSLSGMPSPAHRAAEFLSNINDLSELYHYWLLAGGNLDTVWRSSLLSPDCSSSESRGNVRHTFGEWSHTESLLMPPINRLPNYLAVRHSNGLVDTTYLTELWAGGINPKPSSRCEKLIFLPAKHLIERISHIQSSSLYPLLLSHVANENEPIRDLSPPLTYKTLSSMLSDVESDVIANPLELKPFGMKATNVDYQVRRIRLFKRLLNALPATESRLRFEARKDIPPFLRRQIWTALLGLHKDHDYRTRYAKALCTVGDQVHFYPGPRSGDELIADGYFDLKVLNQIAVDLPRCHAYDSLLASPIGQATLFQVLLATLASSQACRFEYTQGMDSVAAVFVRLCYPDEALASACLRAFLTSKLSNFFCPSGFTVGLKAFFNILLRLFAFHIPRLAVYLTDLGVPLVGLTTGWIYTFFSHTMPLDRTEMIWDTLIVGPLSLVMFFYIAVFLQVDQQINFHSLGLEKICTTLSNFPDIDLDKCRSDALRFAVATPLSLTTGPGLLSQTASRSKSAGNRIPKSANSFYQRLCTPGAWPNHLEHDGHDTAGAPTDLLGISNPCFSSQLDDIPLVSWLDPEDAIEHFERPDCFVLDCRRTSDYSRRCIEGSLHRSPSQLRFLQSDGDCTESSGDSKLSPTSGIDSDWEFVDFQPGTKRSVCIVHPFLAQLATEAAWIKATQARRDALNRQGHEKLSLTVQSPGLIILVGGSDTNANSHTPDSLAILLANWFIRHHVDRVCLLNGGLSALFNVPQASKFITCPVPR